MSTPVKINNPDAKKIKILIAPLDWGLGHVTRCIPIIKELVNQKCIVTAAVSGIQKKLLISEFPTILYVDLPGYDIKYGKNRTLTIFRLITSIPKILIRVNREKAWLRRYIRLEQPDLIISDNRYGLYSREVFSVFITHQLRIQTPWGSVADGWLQRMNYSFIRRFHRCWVPDVPGEGGLAGELSHPSHLPDMPVRYIGWLSRFPVGRAVEPREAVEPFDLLILLSGPEPQRTLLEERLLEQLADYSGRTVLVRGLPAGRELQGPLPPQVTVYNHLPAAALEGVIRGAGQIIARSGYSTVMDLARLGRRAILIPTPGQTEQEYLGNYLASKGWAICIEQKGFSLADALAVARLQGGSIPEEGEELLNEEIGKVLAACLGVVEEPELGAG